MNQLNPLNSPLGLYLRTLLEARIESARARDRGASAIEWAIITALVAGIAIALGTLIWNQVEGAVNQTPDFDPNR